MTTKYYDSEEKNLIEDFEKNPSEWVETKNDLTHWEEAAKAYLEEKSERITIRVSPTALQRIKDKAKASRLKYQTYLGAEIEKMAFHEDSRSLEHRIKKLEEHILASQSQSNDNQPNT